jgi:F-type H+-transporting ATPase subunit alpha
MNGNTNNLIDKKIDDIINHNNLFHTGKVIKINNFIIEATGLEEVFYFEKVIIGDENNIGYVDKIEENKVIIALVKTDGNIKVGDQITSTGEALQSSFSKNSIGMIIDPFGNDKMSGKKFNDSKIIDIETPNISIMDRTDVNRPLETGIAAIDLMFPIGKGQRQLIVGDKKTGKTQICLDTIANQKGKNVICIYVSIGKTKKELKRIYTKLTEKQTNHYTLIVAAFNDDPVPLIKLTPYVAVSIAKELMMEGNDVLVCIDDLKKHADACREIALISEKNTGRDAYPADIFYTHSRLLEKGCQHKNGGSITILPVVETKAEDITDYITTNIISITDGQIVLSDKSFKKGQKPAINFGLSVSRLGGAVQNENVKKVGAIVRRELLSYLETADVYQLVNIESLSDELQGKIFQGQKLLKLLNQPKYSPMSEEKLIDTFGYMAGITKSKIVDELLRDIELTKELEGGNQNPPQDPPAGGTPVAAVPEVPAENAEMPAELQPVTDETVVEEPLALQMSTPIETPALEQEAVQGPEITYYTDPVVENTEVPVENVEMPVETIEAPIEQSYEVPVEETAEPAITYYTDPVVETPVEEYTQESNTPIEMVEETPVVEEIPAEVAYTEPAIENFEAPVETTYEVPTEEVVTETPIEMVEETPVIEETPQEEIIPIETPIITEETYTEPVVENFETPVETIVETPVVEEIQVEETPLETTYEVPVEEIPVTEELIIENPLTEEVIETPVSEEIIENTEVLDIQPQEVVVEEPQIHYTSDETPQGYVDWSAPAMNAAEPTITYYTDETNPIVDNTLEIQEIDENK